MYKNVLQSIEGVDIFPVLGLLVFVPFFVGLLWYVVRMSKKQVSHLENLPLDDASHTRA